MCFVLGHVWGMLSYIWFFFWFHVDIIFHVIVTHIFSISKFCNFNSLIFHWRCDYLAGKFFLSVAESVEYSLQNGVGEGDWAMIGTLQVQNIYCNSYGRITKFLHLFVLMNKQQRCHSCNEDFKMKEVLINHILKKSTQLPNSSIFFKVTIE